MYDEGWFPDLIMCSDSVRTRQTLEAMQAAYPALTVWPRAAPLIVCAVRGAQHWWAGPRVA